MIRTILIIFVSILSTLSVKSQSNYTKYYQLINKTKESQDKKQSDSLTIYLKEAFDLVDYVHIDNLKLGKKVAKKLNDKKLLTFCINSINKSQQKINTNLKARLDSLGKEDQRVRDRRYYSAKTYYTKCLYDTTFQYKEKKRLKSKKLMEEWREIDSCNIVYLKNIISEYGYPSEKIVGKKTNDMVGVILLHYDLDTANHIMGKELNIAIQNGAITPKMYAWIIDRHLMSAGKNQDYYSIPTPWKKMTKEQKEEYNKNRFSIGLKPINESKIIAKKNKVIVKP